MTELSPAAQAVLNGFRAVPTLMDGPSIAGALRAAADQMRMDKPLGDTDADAGVFAAHHAIRAHLLAIAAELEGAND